VTFSTRGREITSPPGGSISHFAEIESSGGGNISDGGRLYKGQFHFGSPAGVFDLGHGFDPSLTAVKGQKCLTAVKGRRFDRGQWSKSDHGQRSTSDCGQGSKSECGQGSKYDRGQGSRVSDRGQWSKVSDCGQGSKV